MKKRSLKLIPAVFLCCAALVALNWPQPITGIKDISVFFGQSLSSTFSSGLTVALAGEVLSAEKGKAVMAISEAPSPLWFNSTLGNALIVSHEDHMLTVYGNLSQPPQVVGNGQIFAEQQLGTTGNSAWQEKPAGVMFQIADTKNQTVFNPLMLLPKPTEDDPPLLRNIILINKTGRRYNLSQTKAIPSDVYYIYRETGTGFPIPYKVSVSINGSEAREQSNFNLIKQNGSVMEISGKNSFPFTLVYPENNLQLLATAAFNRGKASLSISLGGIHEKERTGMYSLEVY